MSHGMWELAQSCMATWCNVELFVCITSFTELLLVTSVKTLTQKNSRWPPHMNAISDFSNIKKLNITFIGGLKAPT
jgi:hypothetical protein